MNYLDFNILSFLNCRIIFNRLSCAMIRRDCFLINPPTSFIHSSFLISVIVSVSTKLTESKNLLFNANSSFTFARIVSASRGLFGFGSPEHDKPINNRITKYFIPQY
jgi:hypothetical protein